MFGLIFLKPRFLPLLFIFQTRLVSHIWEFSIQWMTALFENVDLVHNLAHPSRLNPTSPSCIVLLGAYVHLSVTKLNGFRIAWFHSQPKWWFGKCSWNSWNSDLVANNDLLLIFQEIVFKNCYNQFKTGYAGRIKITKSYQQKCHAKYFTDDFPIVIGRRPIRILENVYQSYQKSKFQKCWVENWQMEDISSTLA